MQRRKFLKGLVGVGVVASGSALGKAKPFSSDFKSIATSGFGLAPAKPEGGMVAFDPLPDVGIRTGHGVMTRTDFVAQLKEGLDTAFSLHYKDSPKEFADFVDEKTKSELDRVKLDA